MLLINMACLMKKTNLPQFLESKTSKAYKSKKLNNANFDDFRHTDYQVYLHLISKIGGVDEYGKYLQPEQLKREYILTAKEFSVLFNVSLSNCYGILKQALDKLMKRDVKIEKPDDSGFWRINICSMAEYNQSSGSITINFTDHIMPYLAQVKEKFVLYNIKEIANFGSLYTTRLYELIQEFKETGWMLKSVKQLREAFAVGDKFKLYGHFKAKTFAHACKEINDNYDLGLSFEEQKEGRKVTAIKFNFKPAVVKEVINQKTGKTTNIYSKPKPQTSIIKKTKKASSVSSPNILEGQLSFVELKPEAKTINSIFSSFLSKFESLRKKK